MFTKLSVMFVKMFAITKYNKTQGVFSETFEENARVDRRKKKKFIFNS
jgi:hypothetical protein